MKNAISVLLMLFIIVGCSNNEIKKVSPEEISWGSLKIYKGGTLVNDIRLMENKELLNEAVKTYNDAKFRSVEEDKNENQVNIDPIQIDGSLEEEFSASHFNISLKSTGNDYYIGYKGENIFKVIASGDSFKDRPYEYFIESKDLKEIIIDNK